MPQLREVIVEKSCRKIDFIDITDKVKQIVKKSKIDHGIVTVYTKHTTTSIRINENEPLLLEDLRNFLENTAPQLKIYKHDDIDMRKNVPLDEPCNAHSHLKSIILGTSETIPIFEGKIDLGTWQSIFLIDVDGPREREAVIHIIGK